MQYPDYVKKADRQFRGPENLELYLRTRNVDALDILRAAVFSFNMCSHRY